MAVKKGYKSCPYCGEAIKKEAVKCRYCGEFLNSVNTTPTVPTRTTDNHPFSTDGRINRINYFIYTITVWLISFIASAGFYSKDGFFMSVGLIMYLFALWFAIASGVKRLHDMNYSGWYLLVAFLPFLNFFLGLWLLFGEGTDGTNYYGEQPESGVITF